MLTIGVPGFLAFVCYAIIFGLLWNVIKGKNVNNAVGKAMAAIH
ncbi:MAG: hypothetical protein AB7H92_18640 [Microbacteriaceae bacterium]